MAWSAHRQGRSPPLAMFCKGRRRNRPAHRRRAKTQAAPSQTTARDRRRRPRAARQRRLRPAKQRTDPFRMLYTTVTIHPIGNKTARPRPRHNPILRRRHQPAATPRQLHKATATMPAMIMAPSRPIAIRPSLRTPRGKTTTPRSRRATTRRSSISARQRPPRRIRRWLPPAMLPKAIAAKQLQRTPLGPATHNPHRGVGYRLPLGSPPIRLRQEMAFRSVLHRPMPTPRTEPEPW